MLRLIVGSPLNQKQEATLENSRSCFLAGMKEVISDLLGLWRNVQQNFRLSDFTAETVEIVTESALFVASMSEELN